MRRHGQRTCQQALLILNVGNFLQADTRDLGRKSDFSHNLPRPAVRNLPQFVLRFGKFLCARIITRAQRQEGPSHLLVRPQWPIGRMCAREMNAVWRDVMPPEFAFAVHYDLELIHSMEMGPRKPSWRIMSN